VDLGLNGRVALVTASSRGLGRAIATALAAEGAKVMVSARDEAALAQTVAEIREATGAEVNYYATDLTRVDDVRAYRAMIRLREWTAWSGRSSAAGRSI
jgi:3-oxoacyl-[acyl-carrier protein] reductase